MKDNVVYYPSFQLDKEEITLDSDYINCFEKYQTLLLNDSVLQYPDYLKEFILTTDLMHVAAAGILFQGSRTRQTYMLRIPNPKRK